MTVSFAVEHKGKGASNLKRVQIHVVEAQGLSLKGSAKSPPAYVTIESPDLGILYQTDTVGRGRNLVWHENTRIVELRPNAQIKFVVKRQMRWPISHHVLGSTDTYNLSKLIEMQGKNDRETCVNLSLKVTPAVKTSKPSLVINIRDLDTQEKIQKVREYAHAAAALQLQTTAKGKGTATSGSDNESPSISPTSLMSPNTLDMPSTPMTTASFSSFSGSSPSSSTTSMSSLESATASTSAIAKAVAPSVVTFTPSSAVKQSESDHANSNNGSHKKRGSVCTSRENSLDAVTREIMQEAR